MNKLLTITLLASLATASADPASVERGKALYQQICMTCHGPHMEGGIGPALSDHFWKHGDSSEAINRAITKGIAGTEMAAFEAIYPAEDRQALTDYILSKQEGIREMVRYIYPKNHFKGKKLVPDLFKTIESTSSTPLPENWLYVKRNLEGVVRVTAKAYIQKPGSYRFDIRRVGRTAIYFEGKEVHYSDEKTPKADDINEKLELEAGTYSFEIFHEEKRAHSYKFYGNLVGPAGARYALSGRSLQGSTPKVIVAGPTAKIERKWIKDLPPRAILCLLPNKVIVAYNTVDGAILDAWHTAEINQTPSLTDRSQQPSQIIGKKIPNSARPALEGSNIEFIAYEAAQGNALIHSHVNGKPTTLIIAPEGDTSFSISTK
jgi:cytochrome c551/c552